MIPTIQDFSQQGNIGFTTLVCEPFLMTEDLHHPREGISFFSTLHIAEVPLTTF